VNRASGLCHPQREPRVEAIRAAEARPLHPERRLQADHPRRVGRRRVPHVNFRSGDKVAADDAAVHGGHVKQPGNEKSTAMIPEKKKTKSRF
jgi:hypothetical protein